MRIIIYVLFVLLIIFKMVVLYVSKENEKKLLSNGAIEYGKSISKYLFLLNTIFYLSVLCETIFKHVQIDSISLVGIMMVEFSYVSLLFFIKILNPYWTTKILIEENNKIKKRWLVKKIKHPEIFLSTVPEFIGGILAFHAWWTFIIICVPYGICLSFKIKLENAVYYKQKIIY